MSHKAVFIDRDKTLIEDPGYISDASAVKLLPGVELAVKSLAQAGYKIVVVTNQSGIARGLLTEEALEDIHGELRRQLHEKGAHLDAIYYCPFHPEGTVEKYAIDSPLRKPSPGMLLKAAADMEIDLAGSWMVGDGARDVEAGARAGCRTIRVRTAPAQGHAAATGPDADESVEADFTVRNLVEAARTILREAGRAPSQTSAAPASADAQTESALGAQAHADQSAEHALTSDEELLRQNSESSGQLEQPSSPAAPHRIDAMDDRSVRQEILRHVRQLASERGNEEFSLSKLLAGILQMLAVLALLMTFWRTIQGQTQLGILWALITIALQVMTLTLFTVRRGR